MVKGTTKAKPFYHVVKVQGNGRSSVQLPELWQIFLGDNPASPKTYARPEIARRAIQRLLAEVGNR